VKGLGTRGQVLVFLKDRLVLLDMRSNFVKKQNMKI